MTLGHAAVATRVSSTQGRRPTRRLFVLAAVLHYVVFQTAHADLGSMAQAIWNTLHGHPLEATSLAGHQVNRLGFHVDPFLLLFAPLFWIWSSPLLLPLVQAVAVASGALPVFWLARKHLGSPRAGAHFAFAYLLYPATQFNAFTVAAGFHPLSMAVPLVLYAVWFLDEDRLLAFLLMALLACTTNEEIPLAVGCLGIWYAVRKGRRLFGFSVFVVGLAVTLFDFTWVIPHFSPNGVDPFAGRYRAVGETPAGSLTSSSPIRWRSCTPSRPGTRPPSSRCCWSRFSGSVCWSHCYSSAPSLASPSTCFRAGATQTSISYEDTAAHRSVRRRGSHLRRSAVQGTSRSALALDACGRAAVVAVYSPIFSLSNDVQALGSPLVAAKTHALDLVPDGVPVSASDQLGGHLSERRYSYTFPIVGQSRWIVVDINDPTYGDAWDYKRIVRKYEADKAWRIVFLSHGICVLHRSSNRGRVS